MARKKILVVDDEVNFLKVISIRLKKEGFDVVGVSDSQEALNMARSEHPDLIILDVLMPGIDGMELGRRIQEDPATRNIPLIFLTALKKQGEPVTGLSEHPVFAKPLDTHVFVQEINRIIS